MTKFNPFLVNWVKSAYSMELGLAPVLEEQINRVQRDAELSRGLHQHLQKTRKHADLLKGCLQRMGENVSAVRPAAPVAYVYGHPDGGSPDTTRQTELVDYVTEAFEVASYRALAALATMVGDGETAKVCEEILSDEVAITQALDQRLPTQPQVPAPELMDDGNARLARQCFEALNDHDLDAFDQYLAHSFRTEAPGMPEPMSREQNRSYTQSYLTAFPDLHFDIERTIANGNVVAVQWIATATHTGPFRGPGSMTVPPTSRKVKVRGNTSFEMKNGKVARSWVMFDTGTLMQQLGLMPGFEPVPTNGENRQIVHLEIPAANRAAAAQFYHTMFGWEFEHMGEPMNYTTFRTGNVGGGFPDIDEVYEPGKAVPYVASDDIDADLRKAGKLGARTIVPRSEIPGFGWFAIIADPTGNHIGLYTPEKG